MIYKNKFIALYDQTDNCVCVADSWGELARFLGKSTSSVQSSISHIFGKCRDKEKERIGFARQNLIAKGQKLTPYIFDVGDEECESNEHEEN